MPEGKGKIMINKLQMKELMSIVLFVVVFGAISGFLFSKVGLSAVSALRGSVALEAEDNLEDMEGKYVSYQVNYPLGEYLETTKTTKVNGVSRGTVKESSSYVVLDENRGIFMSIQVPADRCKEMDQLTDEFYEALENDTEIQGEGLVVKGSLDILTGEDLDYFLDTMESAQLPVESVVYHISDGRIRGNTMGNVYGLSILAAAMGFFAMLFIIMTMKDPVKKRVGRYLAAHPQVTLGQLENDFASAKNIGTVWVGKDWTFISGLKELLFANEDIVWVHTGRERSGRTVSFLVYFNLVDGAVMRASMSSAKKCEEVMNMYTSYPHILTGNNPEYGYLYRSDRQAFLNMKYRRQDSEH